MAVDPKTHDVLAQVLTGNEVSDDAAFPELMAEIKQEINDCLGDGAYDAKGCRKTCHEAGANLIAPPLNEAPFCKKKARKSLNSRRETPP